MSVRVLAATSAASAVLCRCYGCCGPGSSGRAVGRPAAQHCPGTESGAAEPVDRRACRQVSSLSGGPQIRWGRGVQAAGTGRTGGEVGRRRRRRRKLPAAGNGGDPQQRQRARPWEPLGPARPCARRGGAGTRLSEPTRLRTHGRLRGSRNAETGIGRRAVKTPRLVHILGRKNCLIVVNFKSI